MMAIKNAIKQKASKKPRKTQKPNKKSVTKKSSKSIDPITFAVILNRFKTIASEMTITMEKTAWTSIIALARDYSIAIYDYKARQVCMQDALPIHTNSMHVVLEEIAETFKGNIYEGDVIVTNDPYSGNTHVGDFVTATPVFHKGKHMFWSVAKGHQLDCGAYVPTSVAIQATDVWQEGLQLPPIKFYEKGKRCEDVVRMYLANVRWKELLYGDLMAQLGSIWTGQRRLIELAGEYGNAELEKYMDSILDYSDRRMSAEIKSYPDGDYHGVSWLDSDAKGKSNIKIGAKVSVRGDKMHVDFSNSDPQNPSGNNGSRGVMKAAAGIPILCTIDPTIPHNDGVLRHISADAPEGSVCNAKYPASTAVATVGPGDTMQEAVWKALAHAVPDRVMGGNGKDGNMPMIHGVDRRGKKEVDFGMMLFNAAAAGGASGTCDGWPYFMTSAGMGGLKIMSVELMELLYPIRIDRQEIAADSVGHGKYIGGPGIDFCLSPVGGGLNCELFGEGQSNPPFSVMGGMPGIGGGSYKESLKTKKRKYYSSKGRFELAADEIWVGVSSGGGGYGDPLEREPDAVLESIIDGMLTVESARNIYGVIISKNPMTVNLKETKALRKKKRKTRKPLEITSPNIPGAATWVKENLRAEDEYLLDAH